MTNPLAPLTLSEIKALLDRSKEKSTKSWLSDQDRKDIVTAIDHDSPEVSLSGRMYRIKYRADQSVFITPSNGRHVPCANLSISALRREVRNG